MSNNLQIAKYEGLNEQNIFQDNEHSFQLTNLTRLSFLDEYQESFDYDDSNLDIEAREQDAVFSFLKKFNKQYEDGHIVFQYCSLRQAIQYTCCAPKDEQKGLILYLHNENAKFSQMICKEFANSDSDLHNTLENFNVLPWDLDNDIGSVLEIAVDRWPNLGEIKKWIKRKQPAAFIILSDENSVNIFSVFHKDYDCVDNIIATLKIIREIFNKPQTEEIEDSKAIGPIEFQQMMYDRLGDRDYDLYECNQHDELKNKIGFAKFGPPSTENGYDITQHKAIEKTYKAIIVQSNMYSESLNCVNMTVVFNCLKPLPEEVEKRKIKFHDYSEYTDFAPVPIFVIRKCFDSSQPCRIFIDHDNRVYESWSDYINNNKLHKCIMVLPENGCYKKTNDQVPLITHHSPACGVGQAVLKGTDIATSVIGLSTVGVYGLAAIPAITVAPVALTVAAITTAGVGLYSLIRSSMTIHDRRIHGQSMSFASSEARGAYLNIVACSLGFIGAGATTAVSQLAARGVQIGNSAKVTVNVINIANVGTLAANGVNITYEMVDGWIENKTMSALAIVQLSSSILFFHHSVTNFKTANVIIEESQTNTLNNFEKSLRSNRHRKTFNKLFKETISRNNGNIERGRAEVIKSLSKLPSKDETFAFLTRNNKRFNKYGVKFAAEGGQITLNGKPFDAFNFRSVPDINTCLFNLPPVPTLTPEEIKKSVFDIGQVLKSVITLPNLVAGLQFLDELATDNGTAFDIFQILRHFQPKIATKICNVFKMCLKVMDSRKINWIKICKESFVSWKPYIATFHLILQFVYVEVQKLESAYCKRNGYSRALNILDKTLYWFTQIMDMFVNGSHVNLIWLEKLINWMLEKAINFAEEKFKQKERTQVAKNKSSCKICGGFFMC